MLRSWGLGAFPNTLANVILVEEDPNPLEVDWDTLEKEAAAYEPGKRPPLSQASPATTHQAKTPKDDQHECKTEMPNYTMIQMQHFLEKYVQREGKKGTDWLS